MQKNHRVVLVTGASSGIGKCCAEYLSLQDYHVYGTSRRASSDEGEHKSPNLFKMIHKIIRMNAPRLRYTVGKISQRFAVPLKKLLSSRLFESLIVGNFQAN